MAGAWFDLFKQMHVLLSLFYGKMRYHGPWDNANRTLRFKYAGCRYLPFTRLRISSPSGGHINKLPRDAIL